MSNSDTTVMRLPRCDINDICKQDWDGSPIVNRFNRDSDGLFVRLFWPKDLAYCVRFWYLLFMPNYGVPKEEVCSGSDWSVVPMTFAPDTARLLEYVCGLPCWETRIPEHDRSEYGQFMRELVGGPSFNGDFFKAIDVWKIFADWLQDRSDLVMRRNGETLALRIYGRLPVRK